jgi:TP901 family phage tail tape measure protein
LANPAKLTLKIGGEIGASFKKSIKTAQKQVSTFNQNIKRSVNDAAAGASKGFKNVIRNDAFQAAAVGAAALGTGLTKAVRTAADFQSGMLKVKAISGANEEQFKSLTAKAKELGRTTQFSARQASDAMGFLAMAGYDTNQILSATPQMMNLAAAGGLELGEAADIASNILGGMGLKIEDTALVTDVLAKAASSGNTNIQMMGESFKYVAPVAAQAGASIQDMGGAMALLGNSGIQASNAGTGLRSVLLNLSGANTEANKAMAKLGVSNKDAAGNMRPMADILADINKAMDEGNMLVPDRVAMQKQLFGKTAVATGAILQEAAANGELAKMVAKVTDSQGAAGEMAKIQNAGFEGSMKRLASAAEGLAIAFGTPLLGPLATVAEGLAAVLAPVGQLLTDMPVLGLVAGVAAAAFVGFVVVIPIIAAVSGAMAALGITAAGMWAAITGPVGLAVLAVIAVIAIFQLLYNKVEPFRNFVNMLGNEVKYAYKQVVKWFGKLPKRIGKIINHIKFFFKDLFAKVGEMWNNFTDFVGNVLGNIGGIIAAAVRAYFAPWIALIDFVKGLWDGFLDWLGNLPIVEAGKELIDNMLKGIQEGWTAFTAWITEKVEWIKSLNPFAGWTLGRAEKSALQGNFEGGYGAQSMPQRFQPAPGPVTIPTTPTIGLVQPLPARARGGPVSRGQSYLVGERGPELFQPLQSGQILSNRQTTGAELFQPSQAGPMLANRSASVSMAPTINISVANSNASPDDIAAAVARGLDDALMEAEAGVRALLND